MIQLGIAEYLALLLHFSFTVDFNSTLEKYAARKYVSLKTHIPHYIIYYNINFAFWQ